MGSTGDPDRADLQALLAVEAQAAAAYWQSWAPLPIPFTPRDARRVPDHWLKFRQRASLLTGGPRPASNPPNAVLNLLYSLAEFETVVAAGAVGLDPGLGIFQPTSGTEPRWRSISWKPAAQRSTPTCWRS